jgi:hypothetical protein
MTAQGLFLFFVSLAIAAVVLAMLRQTDGTAGHKR